MSPRELSKIHCHEDPSLFREPAIRDFFDIDYAVRMLGLQPSNAEMVDLVKRKLAVPGNPAINLSEARAASLRRQVEAQLRPVLRPRKGKRGHN